MHRRNRQRDVAVQVTGLASLLQAGDILGVLAGGSTAAYFASSADAQATQLHPALVYCADTAACMDLLKSGSIGAFASDRPSLDYLAASAAHGCNLQVVGDPFGPGGGVSKAWSFWSVCKPSGPCRYLRMRSLSCLCSVGLHPCQGHGVLWG